MRDTANNITEKALGPFQGTQSTVTVPFLRPP